MKLPERKKIKYLPCSQDQLKSISINARTGKLNQVESLILYLKMTQKVVTGNF